LFRRITVWNSMPIQMTGGSLPHRVPDVCLELEKMEGHA
jgi:hypothetical protein